MEKGGGAIAIAAGEHVFRAHRRRGERGEQALGQGDELGGFGLGCFGRCSAHPASPQRVGPFEPPRRDERDGDDVLAGAAAVFGGVEAVAAPPDLGDDRWRRRLRCGELDAVALTVGSEHAGADPARAHPQLGDAIALDVAAATGEHRATGVTDHRGLQRFRQRAGRFADR